MTDSLTKRAVKAFGGEIVQNSLNGDERGEGLSANITVSFIHWVTLFLNHYFHD
ncbi:hypothetical protein MTBBW1_520011 [Desulfamplus magnetovallimortis]|uniref:Uncharacterized protein n=1 Tax=Desulfamplus magnetovallimortis TaxID=1246637 RepID=A0A1W1HHM9_9BACT|nr:hypothetical protein MTBBW1_520011 [Desulfamplus magnetovallimortis]